MPSLRRPGAAQRQPSAEQFVVIRRSARLVFLVFRLRPAGSEAPHAQSGHPVDAGGRQVFIAAATPVPAAFSVLEFP